MSPLKYIYIIHSFLENLTAEIDEQILLFSGKFKYLSSDSEVKF